MANDESFFDQTARQLEQGAEKIVEWQRGSPAFAEIAFAADQSTGEYPQVSDASKQKNFENDGGHYHDRVPLPLREPLEYVLNRNAKWTDVLSSSPFSQGYLLNGKALAEFEKFELGNVKQYAAVVRSSDGTSKAYTYLFVANHIDPLNIDFANSQFYVSDMVSQPMFPIEVSSPENLWQLMEQARKGEIDGSEKFSRIMFQKLVFASDSGPEAAVFGLGRLSAKFYANSHFVDSVITAGISGLEFKPNTRLFLSNPVR